MTQTGWRTVRVFISSTFRDMQAERDHLVRFVFPRLREELLKRHIHLVDVDLRWGVTSEQDAMDVCREIIDECRPRFICILGGRYGWTPPGQMRSITEDEVRYAALDNADQTGYHFFYFRDPKATESITGPETGDYREAEGSDSRRRLEHLKQSVRDAGFEPFVYKARWDCNANRLVDLTEFGERVYLDIIRSIDHEFGTGSSETLDEFAEQDAAMETFIEERSQRFVLGGRGPILQALINQANASDGDGYLCLVGEPGSGKSAMLACLSQKLTSDASLMISHFVGASVGSTDVRRTLLRMCHAIYDGCDLENDRQARLSLIHDDDEQKEQRQRQAVNAEYEIPTDLEKLVRQFDALLRKGAAKRRIVILLDAVNQLDPVSQFPDLSWLPDSLPQNARVTFTVLPGPVLDGIRKRKKPPKEIDLPPLCSADADTIVTEFLRRYGKTMASDAREALLAKVDAGTPLYLLSALEELRTLGTYGEITERIRDLPDHTPDLFAWILNRLEKDPGFRGADGRHIGTELVRSFAAYMGASRHGLSQHELVELLDRDDSRGNVAALTFLLRPYLMVRGELLDFYHGQFRLAVEKMYLDSSDQRSDAHSALAQYFRRQADSEHNDSWAGQDARPFVELPFHLAVFDSQELQRLLFTLKWLQAKADLGVTYELLHDIDYAIGALPERTAAARDLELLKSALRLCSRVVQADPSQLRSQLWARIGKRPEAAMQGVLGQISDSTGAPWIMPANMNMPRAGGPLFASFDLPLIGSSAALSIGPNGEWVRFAVSEAVRIWHRATLAELYSPMDFYGPVALRPGGNGGVVGLSNVKLWDFERGVALKFEGDGTELSHIAVTSDGTRAISMTGLTLTVWNLVTAQVLKSIPINGRWRNDFAVLSPDGRRAILASPEKRMTRSDWELSKDPGLSGALAKEGQIMLWDLDTDRQIHSVAVNEHRYRSSSAAVFPCGRWAVFSDDNVIKMWNLETGLETRSLLGHYGNVGALTVSADGRFIVSGSADGLIKVWDSATGDELYSLAGHTSTVNAVSVSPEGTWVASCAGDNTIKAWDLEKAGDADRILAHNDKVSYVVISADGRQAVTGSEDRTLRVWDLSSMQEQCVLSGHRDVVTALASSSCEALVVSGSNDRTVMVWDLRDLQLLHSMPSPDRVTSLTISPDGRWVAGKTRYGEFPVWDVHTLREFRRLDTPRGSTIAAEFHPDGKHIVFVLEHGEIAAWELESGRIQRVPSSRPDGSGKQVRKVVFSPDRTFVLVTTDGHVIERWDLDTGNATLKLDDAGQWLQSMAISPDGTLAACTFEDGTVKVCELLEGRILAAFTGESTVTACAFATDGRTIVAGEKSGRVHILRLMLPSSSSSDCLKPSEIKPVQSIPPFDQLVSRYQALVDAGTRDHGSDGEVTLGWLNCLGVVYDNLGKPAEAEMCYRKALAGLGRRVTLEEALVSGCAFNLKQLLISQGRVKEAETLRMPILALTDRAADDSPAQSSDQRMPLEQAQALALMHTYSAGASLESEDIASALQRSRVAIQLWDDLLVFDSANSQWLKQQATARSIRLAAAQWLSAAIAHVLELLKDAGAVELALSEAVTISLNMVGRLTQDYIEQYKSWFTLESTNMVGSAAYAMCKLLTDSGVNEPTHVALIALLLEDIAGGIIIPGDNKLKNSLYAVSKVAGYYKLPHEAARVNVDKLLECKFPLIAHIKRECFVAVLGVEDSEVVCSNGGKLCRYGKDWLLNRLSGYVLAKRPEGIPESEWEPVDESLAAFVWG